MSNNFIMVVCFGLASLYGLYKANKFANKIGNAHLFIGGSLGVGTLMCIIIFGFYFIVSLVPIGFIASYIGVKEEIAKGTAYLGDKKVKNPSELYLYALGSVFDRSKEGEIKHLENEIKDIERERGWLPITEGQKYRIANREKKIIELKEQIAQK